MVKIAIALVCLGMISSCELNKRDLTENTVIAHLNTNPDGLHITNNMSAARQYIFTITQKALFTTDVRTLEKAPLLIKSLPTISEDGLTYTFELREDVRWDDGTPLTTKDVLFTFKLMMCPLSNNPQVRPVIVGAVDSIRILDDYRFEARMRTKGKGNDIVFNEVYMAQQSHWDPDRILDQISFRDLVNPDFKPTRKMERWFNDFNHQDNSVKPTRLVGLGPYRITEWEQGVQIVCERKENWWGDGDTAMFNHNFPDKIILRIIEDPDAVRLEVRKGNIDVSTRLTTEGMMKLEKSSHFRETYDHAYVDQFAYVYLAMNMRPDGINHKPLFTDKRVRRAIAHLTPVEEIIEVLMYGKATRQVTNISPSKHYYHHDLEPIPFDPEKAKALLDESGWKDTDGDNIRDKMIGGERVPFSFKLNYFSGIPSYRDMALMISNEMRKVGINAEPNPLEFGRFYQNAQLHDFDAMIGSWQGDAGHSDPAQLWSTESWANKGFNFTGFGDVSSDSLIKVVNEQIEPDAYVAAMHAFQEKLYDEQPYVFMYQPKKRVVIHKRFTHPGMFVEKPGVVLNAFFLESGGGINKPTAL